MHRILFLIFFISIQTKIFCQEPLDNSGVERALPFTNAAVTLNSSWIKQREVLNTEYLKSLEPDRLLHNFRVNAGLPSDAKPLVGWEAPHLGLRGHFTGHYLPAVSNLVEKYKDPTFAQRLNYMTDELYKCQQALGNGYLSAFPEKDFDVLETNFGGVWAPYYTYNKIMQGLLDVYIRTGNSKAYEMVVNLASYVKMQMSELDEETIEKLLYTATANPSNEAGAMKTILSNLSVVESNSVFHLNNNGIKYMLRPLYDIEDQSYGVYATIRNY